MEGDQWLFLSYISVPPSSLLPPFLTPFSPSSLPPFLKPIKTYPLVRIYKQNKNRNQGLPSASRAWERFLSCLVSRATPERPDAEDRGPPTAPTFGGPQLPSLGCQDLLTLESTLH